MKKFLSVSLLILSLAFFTGCNLLTDNSNPSPNGAVTSNTIDNSGANPNNSHANEPPVNPTPQENPTTQQPQGDLIEFQGVVLTFNENGAQVEKAIVRDLGDGGMFMGTGSDENEIINIFFDSDTAFELTTATRSTNATVRSEGSVNDLGGSTLTVRGEYQDGSFIARSVEIWRFVD